MAVSDELMEGLADIEHERWSEWQNHVHQKGERQEGGSILLPANVVKRWERQIETSYEDLSEEDKEKDRVQVRRYLPLLEKNMSNTRKVGAFALNPNQLDILKALIDEGGKMLRSRTHGPTLVPGPANKFKLRDVYPLVDHHLIEISKPKPPKLEEWVSITDAGRKAAENEKTAGVRKAFESALLAERVVQRVLSAKENFSDKELVAMHLMTIYKSFARAKELKEFDIEYTPEDPTIKSLIGKGYLKLQGKSMIPNKSKIDKELKLHKAPHLNGQYLPNPGLTFAPSGD